MMGVEKPLGWLDYDMWVTPEEISAALRMVLGNMIDDGSLVVDLPDEIKVERPRNRDHGDWATNIAMQLGKKAGWVPRELAEAIADRLTAVPGVAVAEVAGPGFLNVRVEAAAAGELARKIVDAGVVYGHGDWATGQKINLEFVSANPTGPIHMGGVRWAAMGDSLARVLEAGGADVTREYYFNDHGAQIDRFARSLLAAARGDKTPDDGYGGAYISEISDQIVAAHPHVVDDDDALEVFRREGVELMFAEIKKSLSDFGVEFDVYFHENDLHESGAVETAVQRLRDRGVIFDAEGATWLRTTDFGDDKDRVVIKSDGQPAYISGDLAYYLNKRDRGFDRCLIMLGADHHGYVPRMMAMCAAFGDAPNVNLEILIGQLVNLLRDGEVVKMSKRAGTVVSLGDLVDAVGVDAGRYALARSSADSPLDIDLNLLASHTNDNPVYYVQYAHARTCQIASNAADRGVVRAEGFDPALLDHPSEEELLAMLAQFPAVVEQAGELREPHRVARYLEQVAGAYHKWYAAGRRVVPQGEEAADHGHRTRLWLNDATRTVLANGLTLLGVSAPERM